MQQLYILMLLTRFSDGEFGFGLKLAYLHRNFMQGPMGLKEIMTYKYYVVMGEGQIR